MRAVGWVGLLAAAATLAAVGAVENENNVKQCKGPDGDDPLDEKESEWKHGQNSAGVSIKWRANCEVVAYDMKWQDLEGYSDPNNVERNLYTAFNNKTKKCEVYPKGVQIPCVPFNTRSSCTEGCGSLMSEDEKDKEELQDDEEEILTWGEFFIHLAMMLYFCFGLALVCEDFFVNALEIIIDVLKLAPDVAGATFMAAGSSSPELFVAAVAVFASGDFGHECRVSPAQWQELLMEGRNSHLKWQDYMYFDVTPTDAVADALYPGSVALSKDWKINTNHTAVTEYGWAVKTNKQFRCESGTDMAKEIYIDRGVGVGAVVGSTMFNTLIIIGGSAIVSGKISKLDWRIVMRDGFSYMVGVAALAYCLNYPGTLDHELAAFFKPDKGKIKAPVSYGTKSPLGIIESYEAGIMLFLYASYVLVCAMFGRMMECCCSAYGDAGTINFTEMGAATTSFDARGSTNRPSIEGFEVYKKNRQLQNRRTVIARALVGSILRGEVNMGQVMGKQKTAPVKSESSMSLTIEGGDEPTDTGENSASLAAFNSKLFDENVQSLDEVEEGDEEYGTEGGSEAEHAEHEHSIWKMPHGGKQLLFWALSFPLMFFFTLTIPDTRKAKYKKYYVLTFFMSICWLGLLVDLMVEQAEETFHNGPLQVDHGKLGLTFVAAGTSFPDALASFLVAARGCADMAVSNAFGSNIFDILLGLAFPWCLQTVAFDCVLYVDQMSSLNTSFTLLVGSFWGWFFVLSCLKWNLAPLMGIIMSVIYFCWAGWVLAA